MHVPRLILVLGSLALLIGTPVAQAPASFTIDQVLSAPFPSGLVASSAGQKVAWVFNEKGARNIWVAEGPVFAGRRLTTYKGDNGQEITNLAWTPDGQSIVFVRGGGANRQGEIPNPTSDPGGAEQAVWIVSAAGGEPRKIGVGTAPVISPHGDTVAFLQRGQIWTAGISGTPAAAQSARTRGAAGTLRWSPDSTRIAFASRRGDHGFIGVHDVAARSIVYLDSSVDGDTGPTWSPDGKQIAFIREPVNSDAVMFVARREAEPWSIRIADVAGDAAREVWRAERGAGSVFSAVTGDQLVWTAGNQIVFPWERTGWRLLYAVPVAGGRATLLTPGAFEVEDVAVGPGRTTIVYNSNQDDIDRRDVWRVAPGSAPQRITSGTGIEWNAVPLADGQTVAYFRSDARRTGQPMVQSGSSAPREIGAASMPAEFPAASLVEPEAVTVAAADGMLVHAQLFKPASRRDGEKHPAVIFFHGGSRRQMLLGWHYRDYYHNAYGLNQYLASRGYIVLSVNYRSGTGYGLNFREAINYGADGASEFNDVMGAGLYLRGRGDVDASRIGLWGGSYGGYLTALGLSRASDLFAAGVDVHGVHDWNAAIRNFQPDYNPQAKPDVARRAFNSSPMAFLDGWRSPVLVVHGDDDRNVPFSETVDLVEQLRKRKVHVEQLIFPDEIHGFLLHRRWLQAYKAAADFFERQLKARSPATQY